MVSEKTRLDDIFVDFLPNDGDLDSDMTIDKVDRNATSAKVRRHDQITYQMKF